MKKLLTWSYIAVCIFTLSGNLLACEQDRIDSSTLSFENVLPDTLATDYKDVATFKSLALSEREKQLRKAHSREITEEREEEEVRRQLSSKKRTSFSYSFITIFGDHYASCFAGIYREPSTTLSYFTHPSSVRQHVRLRVFRI